MSKILQIQDTVLIMQNKIKKAQYPLPAPIALILNNFLQNLSIAIKHLFYLKKF